MTRDQLQGIVDSTIVSFNRNEGIDFTKENLIVKFVSGMVKSSVITPYVQDGQLYSGFRWISDV